MSLTPSVSADDHSKGSHGAPVVVVEYGDYQCPHCGRAHPIVKALHSRMGSRLQFVFRNFPLAKIHPHATIAALASEAAARQGKFWEMHDMLFDNQKRLHKTALLEYAEALGLDIPQFRQDMEHPGLQEKIEQDFYSGMRSGVNQTPTFFINGEKYNGNWESDDFYEFVASLAGSLNA